MEPFSASHDLIGKSASAYEHLRRSVVRGQLRPGRRLSPTDLANVFKISVTPVREALVRLAAEGFIAWEASHGYFTKPFTVKEQQDLHETLAVNAAACLQAVYGEPHPVLTKVAIEAPAHGQAADYADLLDTLGALLAERLGNLVLQAVMATLLDRTQLIRRLDIADDTQLATIAGRMRILASAVLAADIGRAEATLATHLAARQARLPQLVDQANALGQRARYP